MKRQLSVPSLLLAVVAGSGLIGLLGLTGCSGFGDFLSRPGSTTAPAAEEAGQTTEAAARAKVLASDAAAKQIDDLTAAIDRLNATQARLQIALQDLQTSATAQAEVARQRADERQADRRTAVLAEVAAAAALLVALLLAIIAMGQRIQLKRAAASLKRAELDARASAARGYGDADGANDADAELVPPRGGAAAAAAQRLREGPVSAGGAGTGHAPRGSDAGAAGTNAGATGNAARLRKRPPVG